MLPWGIALQGSDNFHGVLTKIIIRLKVRNKLSKLITWSESLECGVVSRIQKNIVQKRNEKSYFNPSTFLSFPSYF
jgi:hypothetical protein